MQLSTLKTFLTIVRTGNLVRAAEQLNVTQSTVTARLKVLEAELGQILLKRHKSGVALTSAGVKFKRYAEVMTGLWRQALQETSLSAGIESVCNLGCHPDLWPLLGRELLAAIQREQPRTALSVWPGEHAELEHWLSSGLIDAALTWQPTVRDEQTIHPLRSERLVLVSTRADSPLRFDPDYLYVDAGEDFGRRHAAAYADAGTARLTFGSAVWALDHLLEHGGSAYLPERLVAAELADGRLHRLDGAPVFEREAYLISNDAAAAGWPWLEGLLGRLVETGKAG